MGLAGRDLGNNLQEASVKTSFSYTDVCIVSAFLAGCGSTGRAVESLDLGGLEADEGIVVMRVITSAMDVDDDVETRNDFPEVSYSLEVGKTKSVTGKLFDISRFDFGNNTIEVDGDEGTSLVMRKLDAGEYYFNAIHVLGYASGGSGLLAVRFEVQPQQVTYIGDLDVHFRRTKGLFGWSSYVPTELAVYSDVQATRALVEQQSHQGVLDWTTNLMILEGVSF